MNNTRMTSCASDFEADALSVEDARKMIYQNLTPITGTEKCAIRSCLDRYLAEDIISPINVPSHTNSAMDGYAIAGKDLPTEEDKSYSIIGASFAGTPSDQTYQSGQVVRIMTGGVMPEGTDTVIMQEMVELSDDGASVIIKAEHKQGQNVRLPGEDIAKDSLLFLEGRKVSAADLGILASLGICECKVYRKPRVAFFSTGDELRSVGETLTEGQIYDSNRYTLFAMLKQLNVDFFDMGVVKDTPEAIETAMKEASEMADIVITSGGVSVGEADYIKPTLNKIGTMHFKKVRMKPGRPLTFGSLNQESKNKSWLFGLPGNPVAVMITFLQFVQPAIYYLSSGQIKPNISLKAITQEKIYKRPGRTEFQRGIFEQQENGEIVVKRTGRQGSGILTSMSIANCFIYLAEESATIEVGESVQILPFSGSI